MVTMSVSSRTTPPPPPLGPGPSVEGRSYPITLSMIPTIVGTKRSAFRRLGSIKQQKNRGEGREVILSLEIISIN